MIVMKFGGTSVGTAERLRTACSLVKSRVKQKPFVVVSAHNSPTCRMTNTIIAATENALTKKPDISKVAELQRTICKELDVPVALVEPLLEEFQRLLAGINMIGELSLRSMDLAMSFGERMSSIVFNDVLCREFGVNSKRVASFDLGLRTDGNHGSAIPDKTSYPDIKRNVEALGCDVVVTTGFLGKGPDNHITTLGRGGSDFSGTIFGAALNAEEVQIWTDVDGVMTADPSVVKTARSIPELSFVEASELSWYGAQVLHPLTMQPAIEHNIPVRVLNTGKPDHPGTLIVLKTTATKGVAKSVVYKEHISLVTVTSLRMLGTHGFMAKVFEIFGKCKIDIHMIATSETSVSLTIPSGYNLEPAAAELSKIAEVLVEKEKALVCLVGQNMAGVKGTAARVCGALAKAGVNIKMISQGARELNIALLVEDDDINATVAALHSEFFE
jgi:aspartate kinase